MYGNNENFLELQIPFIHHSTSDTGHFGTLPTNQYSIWIIDERNCQKFSFGV